MLPIGHQLYPLRALPIHLTLVSMIRVAGLFVSPQRPRIGLGNPCIQGGPAVYAQHQQLWERIKAVEKPAGAEMSGQA